LGASSVLAASLGELLVLSNRGEPLNAEIEILPDNEQELAALKAALASPEVYAARAVEPPSELQSITVEVGQNPAGEPALLLRSAEPISGSALHLLIQLNGDDTHSFSLALQEAAPESEEADIALPDLEAPVAEEGLSDELPEFTSEMAELESLPDLLDEHPIQELTPDEIEAYRQLPDEDIPEDFGPLFAEYPQPEPQAEVAAVEPLAEPAPEVVASPAGTSVPVFPADGYTVQKGDTLRNIAVQHWADGVSLEQMMAGLYRANPQAFANGDMNRLKTGEILCAPSVEELKTIGQSDAENTVQMHARNWDTYRNKLAAKVDQSAPVTEEQQAVAAVSGKIDSVQDQSVASGPHDVVKLSSGDAQGPGKTQSKAQLQEDLIARDKSLKEAEERIASLEKQLQDAQRLLELRKPAIGEIGKESIAGSTPGATTPSAEPGFGIATVQEMLHKQPKALPVAGLILAVLVALALLGRRRKKKPLTEGGLNAVAPAAGTTSPAWAGAVAAAVPDEEHVPVFVTSSPELEPQSELPSETQPVDPGWEQPATDSPATQSAVLGMDDIASLMPEPRPVEQDVPEEAGEGNLADLLQVSSVAEPERVAEAEPEAQPELAASRDADDLAASWGAMLAAEEARAEPPKPVEEPQVEEVATVAEPEALDIDDIFTAPQETGIVAASAQPVVDEVEVPVDVPAKSGAEDTFDYDDVFESQGGEPVADATPTTAELAASADVVDETDMDAMVAEAQASGEQEVAGEYPLDLDNLFTAPQEMPVEADEVPAEEVPVELVESVKVAGDDHTQALAAAFDPKTTEDLAGLDFGFDIDLDVEKDATPVKTAKASVPPLDFSNINLNVGGASATEVSGVDESAEVDTKLDLVTAYIDMNDEDGARDLLQEILKEGGPKQIAKAQAMLDQLGSA
jgi:pilus assembly protein FimV